MGHNFHMQSRPTKAFLILNCDNSKLISYMAIPWAMAPVEPSGQADVALVFAEIPAPVHESSEAHVSALSLHFGMDSRELASSGPLVNVITSASQLMYKARAAYV